MYYPGLSAIWLPFWEESSEAGVREPGEPFVRQILRWEGVFGKLCGILDSSLS